MSLHNEEDARAFVASRATPDALRKLDQLIRLLQSENERQNLVAASSLASVWRRHIADSAQLLDHVSRGTSPWIDLGSGAGFPGLVIAILCPERDVRMIESRALRIQWLQETKTALALPNCSVIGQDLRRVETFEAGVISARAFAPLPRLIRLSARFSTNETEWVLPKGRSAEQDVAMLPKSLRGRFHVKQSITDPSAGIVVGRGRIAL